MRPAMTALGFKRERWHLRGGATRMVRSSAFPRLDLFEVRRQLVQARNRHSDNRSMVRRVNGLLCRIYHLDAVEPRQGERIRKAVQIALRGISEG